MTPEEVVEFFAPPPSQLESVMSWLIDGGISQERLSQSANKQVKSYHSTSSL